jgi:hypothetical protein
MLLKSTAALCFGLVIVGLAAAPAQAQNRQRAVVDGTRVTTTDETGRTRTRIVVQRRSFLDGGTEVLPGSKMLATQASPYGYTPLGTVEHRQGGGLRYPLPGPYDLPGRDNPFPSW